MFEQSEQKETRKMGASEVEEDVLKEIDDRVRKRHGEKEYHAPEHSLTVEKNSAEIFSVIEQQNPGTITEEMERGRKTAARAHDMYIETGTDPKTGAMIRLRGFGPMNMPETVAAILKEQGKPLLGNEGASAVELVGIATLRDPGQKVYTAEMIYAMNEHIKATYPIPSFTSFPEKAYSTTEAGENRVVITNPDTGERVDLTKYFPAIDGKPVGLKMDQLMKEDARLGTVAIAMGDLSQGGRFSSEVFRDEGNREFWESKPKLTDLWKNGAEDLTVEEKTELAKEAIGWIGSQIGFLLHQKMRFENTLETNQALHVLPNAEATKAALHSLYGEWDRNLIAAGERTRRAREEYGGLVTAGAYDIPGANQKLERLMEEMSYGDVARG